MAISSASAACAMPGDGPDPMAESGNAMIHAADKYSRGLGARSGGPGNARAARQPESLESRRACDREPLPAGYLPLCEVRDMTLLGRWPLLDDRMSACMPTRIIAAMQRRSSLGDQDAETWIRMHAQACTGDPEAQRAFGRVCENGSYRAAADLQRAFFWYYRAGLHGDLEARRNAERLMHNSHRICPATMAEPMLIHEGQWRITAHLSRELTSASVFDLLEDGTATGCLLGNYTIAGTAPSDMPDTVDAAALDVPVPSSRLASASYRGGWAYDAIGHVLTIIFESESGERRWRSASWQIEILGCKPDSLFGRDRRMVGYTIEQLTRTASCEL